MNKPNCCGSNDF